MVNQLLHFVIPIVSAIIIFILAFIISKCMYKKAPPNVAMVVTGPRGSTTVTGKGCFVIPILQRVDYLSLANMQSDFTSRDEIPTKDAINISVDAVANFAVSTDPNVLPKAAAKFLGYKPQDIVEIVRPVLEGNIREIISQTTLKELIQGDKKIFAERVIENVAPNLRDMGLELTTFNIQNFKDRNGVIDNLGLENTVQISKDASIAKARAQQEIAIAEAESARVANEAQIKAQTEIAERQNALSIRKAELKVTEDQKRAEADAAYKIQEQEQQKTIEIATANANLARQEKEIELQERAVTIKERQLEAEVKKTADANKYASQQKADATLYTIQKDSEADLYLRQKKAEAEKFEIERQAEAKKARAEAEKFAEVQKAEAVRATGEAEAAAIKARGAAEAAAIQARGEAEAAAILKKAEAMKEYGEAARAQQELDVLKVYFEQLPAIASAVASPMGQIGNITMYGGDTSALTENVTKTIKQVLDGVHDSTGLDPMSLLAGVFGTKMLTFDK